MLYLNKIWLLILLFGTTILCAQTPGFNYQALILNTEEIQIPGTNVTENKVPLGLQDVILRFTITNDVGIEYTEEHTITTDENGMVSVIVGEGIPTNYTFSNIIWDGKLKFLNVELNITGNTDGFVFLDTQKILYIPHPSSGTGNINIVNTIGNLTPPYNYGDLIWLTSFGSNKNPTLMIWNGANWVPVNQDYDPTNELGLIVVTNTTSRDAKFTKPIIGDQVWNKSCECLQVFNGSNWATITTKAINGLYKDGNTTKLGGVLIQPTEITTNTVNTLALKGLQQSTSNNDQIIVANKDTGILKQQSLSAIIQQKQLIIFAIDGQLEFSTPLNITSIDKIDVYRNGVRISFTAINNTTIKLESEARCYKNDKIRIVQLY